MKRTLIALLMVAGCDSGNGTEDTTLGEGDLYPALAVETCDGAAIDMRTVLATKDVTYITFAAQWCTACQEEVPRINDELFKELVTDGGKSVGVVQMLIEHEPGSPPRDLLCSSWKEELEADFDVWVDPRQEHLDPFFGAAGTGQLPVHLIVTKDGIIRSKIIGALPSDIKQRVEAWLPQ